MNLKESKYTLLTFYKFVNISDPHEQVADHLRFCVDIGLRGRIYIGEEGISATLTGNEGQIKAYRLYLDSIPYFKEIDDIDVKATEVEGHQFVKMIVRYRKEIVSLGFVCKAEDVEKSKVKMPIEKFKEVMDKEDDSYVILDMRNNYEYKLGHFKNAIPAGTVSFKDLEKVLDDYRKRFTDKKLIMYCTGGIRCEKASIMLEQAGLSGVYQVDGGVVKYVNTYNDGNWEGNLYTFDGRISTHVGDETTHKVISRCHYTGEPAETFYNCRYGPCNSQFIALEKEYERHFGFCSAECVENAKKDLFVRVDKSIDNMQYKDLRGKIKSDPYVRPEITEIIVKHLDKHLAGVEFNHAVPVDPLEVV